MSAQKIKLRRVQPEDCLMLWQWVNDSSIRSASFTSQHIPWETHRQWFIKKLQDPDCYYWIAINEHHKPIGQVRFDLTRATHEATISMSLAPNWQGLGYGASVIKTASNLLFEQTPIQVIHALIKAENHRSMKTFEKAGFCKVDDRMIQGCASSYYQKVKLSTHSTLINAAN